MISPPPFSFRPRVRQWLIHESTDRWIRAVRRFAPEYFEDSIAWSIRAGEPVTAEWPQRIPPGEDSEVGRRVVLWQVDQQHFQVAAAAIAQTRLSRPDDLQIAAVGDLTFSAQMALSETGILMSIRHPEQLPSLGHMIRAYFVGETTSHRGDHPSA